MKTNMKITNKTNTLKGIVIGTALAMAAIQPIHTALATGLSFDATTTDAGAIPLSHHSCDGIDNDCSIVASEPGFLQEAIYDPATGKTQYRTVIAEQDPITGETFVNESFVHQGSLTPGGGGVRNNLDIASISDPNDTIEIMAEVNTGDYNTSAADGIRIGYWREKTTTTTDSNGNPVTVTKKTHIGIDTNKESMGAAQEHVGSAIKLSDSTIETDGLLNTTKQEFRFAKLEGAQLTPGTALTVGGSTLTASAGTASFETVWIGSDFGGGDIGIQTAAAENHNSSRSNITTVAFGGTGFSGTVAQNGFDWDQTFGSGIYAPSF